MGDYGSENSQVTVGREGRRKGPPAPRARDKNDSERVRDSLHTRSGRREKSEDQTREAFLSSACISHLLSYMFHAY